MKESFLSEIQISCGTKDNRLAKDAPAPRRTKSAGKAQQIKVLSDEKRLRKEMIRFTLVSFYLVDIIAGVLKYLLNALVG